MRRASPAPLASAVPGAESCAVRVPSATPWRAEPLGERRSAATSDVSGPTFDTARSPQSAAKTRAYSGSPPMHRPPRATVDPSSRSPLANPHKSSRHSGTLFPPMSDTAPAILGRAELRRDRDRPRRRPAAWSHLVRHDPAQRVFECLRLDDQIEIWLICWMPGHDTGFHDHDLSSGAVVVAQGAVVEERLRLGGPPSLRRYVPGRRLRLLAGGHPSRDPCGYDARDHASTRTRRRCGGWAPT